MKWIVKLPDGKEIETEGGDESAAASNAVDRTFPNPESISVKPFTVQVRRKHPSCTVDQPKTVYVKAVCYWYCTQFSGS